MSNDESTNKPFSQNETDALTGMELIHAMSIACQGVIDVPRFTQHDDRSRAWSTQDIRLLGSA